jgi:hypothetical protein
VCKIGLRPRSVNFRQHIRNLSRKTVPLKEEKQCQGTNPVHVPPGEPPSQEPEGVSRALRNKGEVHRVHLVHNCQGQKAWNRVGTKQEPSVYYSRPLPMKPQF